MGKDIPGKFYKKQKDRSFPCYRNLTEHSLAHSWELGGSISALFRLTSLMTQEKLLPLSGSVFLIYNG